MGTEKLCEGSLTVLEGSLDHEGCSGEAGSHHGHPAQPGQPPGGGDVAQAVDGRALQQSPHCLHGPGKSNPGRLTIECNIKHDASDVPGHFESTIERTNTRKRLIIEVPLDASAYLKLSL